jgi:hypothetical protein
VKRIDHAPWRCSSRRSDCRQRDARQEAKLSLMPIAEALLTDDIVVTASSAGGLSSSALRG